MPDIHKIQTVIFDLGKVIINLDLQATYRAFAQLSGKSLEEIGALVADQDFFETYEAGEIDDPTFRANIRQSLDILNEDEEIDAAWNAMLKDIPPARLQLIDQMSSRFRIFMMSNTNEIHFRQIQRIAAHASGGKELRNYFEQMYLSQEIGVCKPDAGAWQVILDDHQLDPATTLFIDDKAENIEGAAKLGLQTFHNVQSDDWMALFA